MQSLICTGNMAEAFVTFSHWALDISHDQAVLVIKELDSDLSNLQKSRKVEL